MTNVTIEKREEIIMITVILVLVMLALLGLAVFTTSEINDEIYRNK